MAIAIRQSREICAAAKPETADLPANGMKTATPQTIAEAMPV
ncbi:MAG: hypothetical protein AB7V13_19885 [Pseudorhodoplanes sp.]